MRRRFFVACALATAASACSSADSLVHGPARLRVDRADAPHRSLLDVPVEVSYCASDTTLRVLGADRSWSVVVALRTPWPARSLEYSLDSVVGGQGTAALALRPLRDSVGAAVTAVSGTFKLDAGPKVSGALDFAARGEHDTVRLVGSLTAAAVTPGGCPAP